MLLHHARRQKPHPTGRRTSRRYQDRSQWDSALIAEGVDIAQAALARDRARRISSTGRDRRGARRCAARGGNRLGPDRPVVRRATPASPIPRSSGSIGRSQLVNRTAPARRSSQATPVPRREGRGLPPEKTALLNGSAPRHPRRSDLPSATIRRVKRLNQPPS